MVDLSLNVAFHGIELPEGDSGVSGRESPVCAQAAFFAVRFPFGHFFRHRLRVLESPPDALPGQYAQFHLRHVEPASASWRVDQTQLAGQAMRLRRRKRRIQAGDTVRVEVVADQRDPLDLRPSS